MINKKINHRLASAIFSEAQGRRERERESRDLDHLVVPEDQIRENLKNESTQNINTQAKRKGEKIVPYLHKFCFSFCI